MIKQALKSSGANCTEKHMEDISMCGLLLLSAAKKVDKEFQTPPTSSHHTTKSAKEDIERMTKYLLEEKVPETCTARSTPTFEFLEPIELGMEMVVKGWIKKYLQSTFSEIDHEEQTDLGIVEIDYDISDTLVV